MVSIYTGIMAAPTTAYITEKGRNGLADSASSMTAVKDVSLAKYIQNTTPTTGEDWGDGYFNAADSLAERDAKIRDIFKIDGFAVMVEGDGDKTFVGFCYSRTSPNGLYHKTERFSGVKVPIATNTTAELLIDAGLNRKGTLTINSGITNAESDLANNGFKITLDYRSSFYNATTAYGIQWRKQGDTPYNSKTIGTIATKVKESKSAFSIDVDPTDTLFVEAPFVYEINAFITNEEGTILGALNNVTIVPITLSLYYGTTRENAYLYGTAVNYYKSRRLDEGATLYSNSTATIPVAAGFYMDKTGTAPYFYYECNASGVVIGIGEYNPSVMRVLYEPSGLGSTEANAITDANSSSWVPKYTIYLDNDGYWYANSTGITLAADGYYLVGDSELSYETIYLIGGLQQY